jgi:hypothetical protein
MVITGVKSWPEIRIISSAFVLIMGGTVLRIRDVVLFFVSLLGNLD